MAKLCKLILLGMVCLISLSACGQPEPVCPSGSITYSTDETDFPGLPSAPESAPKPVAELTPVQIGRKTVEVDRVISGPLCNDHLRGVVYVSCDLVLKEWADQPDFLDGCDFTVEPDTIIYVASHNDSAYYNGCSACHLNEEP